MLNCSNQSKYYVEVTNEALMVMRFSIIFGSYVQRTDNILIGGTRRLYFPEGTDRATILMEGLYPPGVWVKMLDQEYETNQNYCFSVYGTFLLPFIKVIPCTNSSNVCSANELQMKNQERINCMYKSYLSSIAQCNL